MTFRGEYYQTYVKYTWSRTQSCFKSNWHPRSVSCGRRLKLRRPRRSGFLWKLLLHLRRRWRSYIHRCGVGSCFDHRTNISCALKYSYKRCNQPITGRSVVAKIPEDAVEEIGVEFALFHKKKEQKTRQGIVVQNLAGSGAKSWPRSRCTGAFFRKISISSTQSSSKKLGFTFKRTMAHARRPTMP